MKILIIILVLTMTACNMQLSKISNDHVKSFIYKLIDNPLNFDSLLNVHSIKLFKGNTWYANRLYIKKYYLQNDIYKAYTNMADEGFTDAGFDYQDFIEHCNNFKIIDVTIDETDIKSYVYKVKMSAVCKYTRLPLILRFYFNHTDSNCVLSISQMSEFKGLE